MEKTISAPSGWFGVVAEAIICVMIAYSLYSDFDNIGHISVWIIPAILMVLLMIISNCYLVLDPNESAVLSFLGQYKGTVSTNGFILKNPFYRITRWSKKVSNYAMETLKVNDKNGVPIEIAAIVVYKIGDTYKAQYDVEDLDEYIENQFEISLRTLSKNHTYSELSTEEKDFVDDLTEKVSKAGVIILDAKITHLNYVPEIAAAMLQKQQASSLSDAKEIIVSTAVHIAKNAANEIENMTQDQKAIFISNLIVVLCSEKAVSPVLSV